MTGELIPSETQMELLREKDLGILKTAIEVCEKLGVSYFIVQGTLLGAVRHGGFIPWDDDLDIGMLRSDYNKFLAEAPSLFPPELFLQTHYSDRDYPHGFAKIRLKGTAFVENSCRALDMEHGIFIDVFPFDRYPDGFISAAVFDIKKLLLRYRIRQMLCEPRKPFGLKTAVQSCLKFLSRTIYPDIDKALEKQTELYGSVKKGRRLINNGSPWGKRECFPADWIGDTCELSFEGIKVKAPVGFHDYLEKLYGNYMQLPPEKDRRPHHDLYLIDFDHSYSPKGANNKTD